MGNIFTKSSEAGVDRLSELPDEILHEILYFAGMAQAVQMSVLSKRWNHIWRHTPHLNFDASGFSHDSDSIAEQNDRLFDFAERVALLRDYERCAVQKVRFAMLYDYESNDTFITFYEKMHMWLDKLKTVVGLEKVELCCTEEADHHRPQTVRFAFHPWTPCRRDLKLSHMKRSVEYLNLNWHEFGALELVLSDKDGAQIENISIINCKLASLKISQRRLKVLKLLGCWVLRGRIRVFAPNLVSLDCRQVFGRKICFQHAPSRLLNDVVLSFHLPDTKRDVNLAIQLMRSVKHARTLALSQEMVETLSMNPHIFGCFPTFHNLRHLVILCTFGAFGLRITLTRDLLKRLPNLETLKMKESL